MEGLYDHMKWYVYCLHLSHYLHMIILTVQSICLLVDIKGQSLNAFQLNRVSPSLQIVFPFLKMGKPIL